MHSSLACARTPHCEGKRRRVLRGGHALYSPLHTALTTIIRILQLYYSCATTTNTGLSSPYGRLQELGKDVKVGTQSGLLKQKTNSIKFISL